MSRGRSFRLSRLVPWAFALGGCASDEAVKLPTEGNVAIDVCDAARGPFSLAIDNPFFPLAVGQLRVYEGEGDGALIRLEIRVLDETENVGGVTTRVLEEKESEDDEVIEISRNYFAQAPDGTVCYFGEAVDIYEGGLVASHDGAWRAEGGNRAGIIMPPAPAVGMIFEQEVAPGIAQDMAEVKALGEATTTPAGAFTDTLRTLEWTPLESGTSTKIYARGVGLIVDSDVRLVSGP